MMYTCPVCGYNRLTEPAADYNICNCCGTEFGYDDATTSHSELRRRWILNGALWWDTDFMPQQTWSPRQQLKNIGYTCTPTDLRNIARVRQEEGSGKVIFLHDEPKRLVETVSSPSLTWNFDTKRYLNVPVRMA